MASFIHGIEAARCILRLSTTLSPPLRSRVGYPHMLASFARAEDGSVAVIFALIMLMLCLFVGAAIDIGRWLHARQQTLAAIDAAVLAGGRMLQLDPRNESDAIGAAMKYYSANTVNRIPLLSENVSFSPTNDKTAFTGSNDALLETVFLKLAHIDTLPLRLSSKAQIGNPESSVEVSLILDMTGSMAGRKLEALKEAATDLVTIVLGRERGDARVALVPYSNSVNVGSYAELARGAIASGTCSNPGCKKFRFKNPQGQTPTHDISSCVSERVGVEAYTDASPSVARVGTNYPSSNNPCPSTELVALTTDRASLEGKIRAFRASGSTGGHIGIGWGWYVLSPRWSGVFSGDNAPSAYGDEKNKKIAVLMTDGEYNSSYCNGVISQDSTSGSGSASDHINCNAPNGHSFNQSKSLCASMKRAGIEIYTVGFDVVDDGRARELIADCATDPSHAYLASSSSELLQSFRDIALKISSLYLSQ